MHDVDVNAIEERATMLALHRSYARWGFAALAVSAALFGGSCHNYSTLGLHREVADAKREAAEQRGVAEECRRWTR